MSLRPWAKSPHGKSAFRCLGVTEKKKRGSTHLRKVHAACVSAARTPTPRHRYRSSAACPLCAPWHRFLPSRHRSASCLVSVHCFHICIIGLRYPSFGPTCWESKRPHLRRCLVSHLQIVLISNSTSPVKPLQRNSWPQPFRSRRAAPWRSGRSWSAVSKCGAGALLAVVNLTFISPLQSCPEGEREGVKNNNERGLPA